MRRGLTLKLALLLAALVVAATLSAALLVIPPGPEREFRIALVPVLWLGCALAVGIAIDVVVTRPITRLARQVRRLDIDRPIKIRGTDEPRELAEALERLRRRVQEERARLHALNDELELRVRERTAALSTAQKELARADKLASVGRLAGGVAHEINNPAGVILGRASFLLEDGTLPADAAEDVKVIARQAERIREITGQLLRFARRTSSERRAVDLAEVARDALALVRIDAKKKNVALGEDLAPMVRKADAGAIEQVAFNLLRNAVQAARGKVRVRTGDFGLVVEDDGPGIAPEHLPRLFEPFFTTKAPGEGTGLGLAVVHGIVADHGGTVHVENRAEGGARFVVQLP
ncbi:MAG: sensor histidine kinase [Myxococcota bacterium]